MTLVDTPVWIDHSRRGDEVLASLLEKGEVLAHPLVIGELALGNLSRRDFILRSLRQLPRATTARDDGVVKFVDREQHFGIGIEYVDVHLLAATRLSAGASFWIRDRRLLAAAERLSLATRLFH